METKLKKINEQCKLISLNDFAQELFDAIKYLSIYETKLKDSRLENYIYLPRLQQIEALSSMKIEGTQSTINDVLENEAFPNNKNQDVLEVFDYMNALAKFTKILKFEDFSDELIKHLHKSLLANSSKRIKGSRLGEYKEKENYIGRGGTKIYVPPKPEETQEYMNDLIDFMNDDTPVFHYLINSAIIHSQFESIHPFDDGNGRIGRLLITLYLSKKKVIYAPLFYISEAFEKDKIKYYKNLSETRNGNYNEWIIYFLSKTIEQTKKHIDFIDKINKLYDETFNIINKNIQSSKNKDLTNALFRHPQLTIKGLAEILNVSSTQANRYLTILENEKILIKNEKIRNVSYFFYELIDMII